MNKFRMVTLVTVMINAMMYDAWGIIYHTSCISNDYFWRNKFHPSSPMVRNNRQKLEKIKLIPEMKKEKMILKYKTT